MMNVERLDWDKISVLSAGLVLCLGLTRLLEISLARRIDFHVLGTAAGFELSTDFLLVLAAFGLGIAAAESLVRSHPSARSGQLLRSYPFWIVPACMMIGLTGFLNSVNDLGRWSYVMLASMLLIPTSLVVEFVSVDHDDDASDLVKITQSILVLLSAMILFYFFQSLRARSLISGSLVLLFSTFLFARYFWKTNSSFVESLLYGFPVGLILGFLTWIMNYSPLGPIDSAAILLTFSYLMAGLIQKHRERSLSRSAVAEHAITALASALIILSVS